MKDVRRSTEERFSITWTLVNICWPALCYRSPNFWLGPITNGTFAVAVFFVMSGVVLYKASNDSEKLRLQAGEGWTDSGLGMDLKVSGWKNIERTREEDNLSKNSQAFIGVIAKRTQFRFRWRLGAIFFQQVFDWSETTFYYKLSKKQLQMRAAGDPGPSSGFHGLPKETCSTWSHVKSQWWAKRTAKPTCKSFS